MTSGLEGRIPHRRRSPPITRCPGAPPRTVAGSLRPPAATAITISARCQASLMTAGRCRRSCAAMAVVTAVLCGRGPGTRSFRPWTPSRVFSWNRQWFRPKLPDRAPPEPGVPGSSVPPRLAEAATDRRSRPRRPRTTAPPRPPGTRERCHGVAVRPALAERAPGNLPDQVAATSHDNDFPFGGGDASLTARGQARSASQEQDDTGVADRPGMPFVGRSHVCGPHAAKGARQPGPRGAVVSGQQLFGA